MILRAGNFRLDLGRPQVMGIVNVTPDSFSDGGTHASPSLAVDFAQRLVEDGAQILDIGGESTRPGAEPVSVTEELDRVMPVLEQLRELQIPISIDTYKPEVMAAALAAGASIVNDVKALGAPGALEVVARSNAAVCLMHMQGEPRTMQDNPRYGDVVQEVREFLGSRLAAAEAAGIGRERLLVDPGFGFGKTFSHNLDLLRQLETFRGLGAPVLVGISRKGMLGKITGRGTDDRVYSSVAAALLAVIKGASIVRVHDVRATRDALEVYSAVTG